MAASDPERLTLVRGLHRRLGALHARQCLRYSPEERLDVVAQFRARLDEHEVVFACLVLALLRCHLALVVEVRLVAHQHNDDVVPSLGPHIVYPLPRVLEGLCVCAPG